MKLGVIYFNAANGKKFYYPMFPLEGTSRLTPDCVTIG